MSITSLPFTSRAADPVSRRAMHPVLLALLVALPIALAMSWARTVTIWRTGTFFDTDDAMRAVQLRDWMAGQGWFDLTATRLDPPAGVFMHWSRVVDVPLAILRNARPASCSPSPFRLLSSPPWRARPASWQARSQPFRRPC